MQVKQKRVLKNGAIAGYVYYPKDRKWKWRIIGKSNKKKGAGKIPNRKWGESNENYATRVKKYITEKGYKMKEKSTTPTTTNRTTHTRNRATPTRNRATHKK